VTVLYDTHYRDLIRLAALLVNDVTAAEEVVQDAFVIMHSAWRQLRDSDEALSYLRRTVVSRSRFHRPAHPEPPGRQPALPGGGQVITYPEPDPLAALRTLPSRQREALVLRYYADFPETQVASVMGISTRAVNNHIARGMFSLQAVRDSVPLLGPPETAVQPDKRS
jgi:DNA-directed RNA polymerase specialized sigma24 family protein